MVLPGVRMGTGSVLGAASVATKDIPAYSVCVGSPAKEVRKRSELVDYTLSYSPFFE
jgi:acetyltransferase-like isoleucine patch superfamily enzyme